MDEYDFFEAVPTDESFSNVADLLPSDDGIDGFIGPQQDYGFIGPQQDFGPIGPNPMGDYLTEWWQPSSGDGMYSAILNPQDGTYTLPEFTVIDKAPTPIPPHNFPLFDTPSSEPNLIDTPRNIPDTPSTPSIGGNILPPSSSGNNYTDILTSLLSGAVNNNWWFHGQLPFLTRPDLQPNINNGFPSVSTANALGSPFGPSPYAKLEFSNPNDAQKWYLKWFENEGFIIYKLARKAGYSLAGTLCILAQAYRENATTWAGRRVAEKTHNWWNFGPYISKNQHNLPGVTPFASFNSIEDAFAAYNDLMTSSPDFIAWNNLNHFYPSYPEIGVLFKKANLPTASQLNQAFRIGTNNYVYCADAPNYGKEILSLIPTVKSQFLEFINNKIDDDYSKMMKRSYYVGKNPNNTTLELMRELQSLFHLRNKLNAY